MKFNTLLFTLLATSSVSLFAQEKNDFIYANMETVNAKFLQQENPNSIQILSSKDGISAIYFHPTIAESLHGKFAHGHGYIFQNSKEEAVQSLHKTVLQKKAPFNYTITEQAFINETLNDFDVRGFQNTISYTTRSE